MAGGSKINIPIYSSDDFNGGPSKIKLHSCYKIYNMLYLLLYFIILQFNIILLYIIVLLCHIYCLFYFMQQTIYLKLDPRGIFFLY